MAAYRLIYDSYHLQADCREPGSALNPTIGNRVWATFTFFAIWALVSRVTRAGFPTAMGTFCDEEEGVIIWYAQTCPRSIFSTLFARGQQRCDSWRLVYRCWRSRCSSARAKWAQLSAGWTSSLSLPSSKQQPSSPVTFSTASRT